MSINLLVIPRVESKAPNKNTIEWEIPDEISAVLMLVDKVGYIFLVKIKQEKRHWWSRSWKIFTTKAADPAAAVLSGFDFLEKHGYTIDHNSVQFGEKIGDPEFLKNEKI